MTIFTYEYTHEGKCIGQGKRNPSRIVQFLLIAFFLLGIKNVGYAEAPPVCSAVILGSSQTICAGQSGNVNVNLSGVSPFSGTFNIQNITTLAVTTYSWNFNAPPGFRNITIPASSLPNTTNTPITYHITWNSFSDGTGCTGPVSGSTYITVNPLPQIDVTPTQASINMAGTPAGSVCPGTTILFTISPEPGNTVPATFTWSVSDGITNTTLGSNIAYGAGGTNVNFTVPPCPYDGSLVFTFSPTANQAPNCWGSSEVRTFLVQDNVPPALGPNGNTTLECSDAAGITAARAFVPTASNTNCGESLIVVEGAEIYTPSCGNAAPYAAGKTGTLVTTFTVTESCGASTTITQTITINDTQAPVFTSAPGSLNRTVEYCDNIALANAQALLPTVSDNCTSTGSIVITKTAGVFATGSCAQRGTITNSFRATDMCGNSSVIFTQVITINDTQGPVFSTNVPAATTLDVSAGVNCTIPLPDYSQLANFVGAGQTIVNTTIDCATAGGLFPAPGPISFTQSPVAGTPVNGLGGGITVTVTATDVCGNSSTRSFFVSFVDQTPPVATCRNNVPTVFVTLNAQGNSTLNPSFFNNGSMDNCTPANALTFSLTSPGFENAPYAPFSFTCNDVGSQTVTLIVTDASGNSATCTTNVTVRDVTPPVFLNCPPAGLQPLAKDAGCSITLPNFVTTLNIQATDACGNTPLVYALAGPGTQPNTITQTPVPGTIYGAGVNSTLVTIRATDTNGNSSTCTFTVNFVDNTAPAITCPANITVNTPPGNTDCTVIVNYTAPTATDNCAVFPNPTTITPVRIEGLASGSFFFVGVNTISYMATDAAGNTSTCTFTVTVVDNTNPTIQCTSNKTVSAGAGCTYTHDNDSWNATAQDNCLLATPATSYTLSGATVVTIPFNTLNGRTFNLGTTTVTARAMDASGNSSTCSFTVTVLDNQVPSITCPGNQTANTNTAGCRAIVTLPAPVTVDNCTTTLEWLVTGATPNSSGTGIIGSFTFNVGTSQVQYRISDANGNSQTCSFNVVVNNIVTGTISGTASAAQNVATTSTITFTGAGGQPNYTFMYDVSDNGSPFGPVQTISTTGGQNIVTVAQSNAQLGTYQYRLLAVTDGSGCTGTISIPATATITVVAGTPDLTSSQFFSTTQIAPGQVIDEVIVLRNVGTAPTSGPITINFTNYSALTGLTINPIAAGTAITIGIDTYTISSGWTFNAALGTLTSNNVIPAGGSQFIGLRISRGTDAAAGANGSVTQTTTIPLGTGGGETPGTNNSISNQILKN